MAGYLEPTLLCLRSFTSRRSSHHRIMKLSGQNRQWIWSRSRSARQASSCGKTSSGLDASRINSPHRGVGEIFLLTSPLIGRLTTRENAKDRESRSAPLCLCTRLWIGAQRQIERSPRFLPVATACSRVLTSTEPVEAAPERPQFAIDHLDFISPEPPRPRVRHILKLPLLQVCITWRAMTVDGAGEICVKAPQVHSLLWPSRELKFQAPSFDRRCYPLAHENSFPSCRLRNGMWPSHDVHTRQMF